MKQFGLILCYIIFTYSCVINNSVIIRSNIDYNCLIKYENVDLFAKIKFDSLNIVKPKLYEKDGIKLVDLIIRKDSIVLNYCVSNRIEKSLNDNFYLYNSDILISDFFVLIFHGFRVKKDIKYSFNYNYEINKNNELEFNISSLNDKIEIKLNSNNFRIIDSTIYLYDVGVLINNRYKLELKSIND
jgi:hypothetical protein